jgi:hypothetical protein
VDGDVLQRAPVTTPEETPSSRPRVGRLRGAGVDVDARLAGRIAIALVLVTLLVVAIVLFIAGGDKNTQISSLREHGVPVTVTVTGCVGLLGGSGSNFAGYACRGSYTLDGRQFNESIPGDALLANGAHIEGVAVPGDPGLLSTPSLVASQRASARVFILPAVLSLVFVAIVVLLFWRRRSRRRPAL